MTFCSVKTKKITTFVSTFSGVEKARLSLTESRPKTPKLLILDEITNNLDLETKEHVVQVLNFMQVRDDLDPQ